MDVCAHVCVVACAYVWRSEVDAGCLFFSCSSFCFWGRVSDQTRTSLVCLDWLTSKPQCWLGCKQPLSVQAGDPNLGSHACLLNSPVWCPLWCFSYTSPDAVCCLGILVCMFFLSKWISMDFLFFVPFLSLGIIILGFIHIEVYSHFIVSNRWEPCDYTTVCWIHLPMTYSGCLQAWVIGCHAALNFHGHSFVRTCTSVFWHRQLGAEWLLHGVSVFSSQLVYE